MDMVKRFKAAFLGLVLVLPAGCASLEATEAKAAIELELLGLGKIQGEIKFKKKEKEEKSSALLGATAAQAQVRLSATNAAIPNQTTLATLSLKNSLGQLIAARTFIVDVVAGVGSFSHPIDVETWLGNQPVPTYGSISVTAADIEIRPPSHGIYTVTNTLVLAGQAVASATASRNAGIGGPGPVTIEL